MSKKSHQQRQSLVFILGLFYSTGFNKEGRDYPVHCAHVHRWGVGLASPELATIVSIAGAYLGYSGRASTMPCWRTKCLRYKRLLPCAAYGCDTFRGCGEKTSVFFLCVLQWSG